MKHCDKTCDLYNENSDTVLSSPTKLCVRHAMEVIASWGFEDKELMKEYRKEHRDCGLCKLHNIDRV
jgi:hypothetical protein